MRTAVIIITILFILSAVFLPVTIVQCTDGEKDKNKDHKEDEAKRKVIMEKFQNRVEIELKQEGNESENKVKLKFDTWDARVEVKFEVEENHSETEEKIAARFFQLFEYVDENENNMFDGGEEILSCWNLSNNTKLKLIGPGNGTVSWAPLTYSDITTDNGTVGKKISGDATFGPNDSASFGLDFYVFGDFALIGNDSLRPTEMKTDIIIQNYPYTHNDSTLALALETKAEHEFKRQHADIDSEDEEGMVATGTASDKEFSMSFRWQKTAQVEGVNQTVYSTMLKNETEYKDEDAGNKTGYEEKEVFVLSYGRGDDVVHDPVVGVSYSTIESVNGDDDDDSPAFAIVCISAALVTTAAFVKRKRYR